MKDLDIGVSPSHRLTLKQNLQKQNYASKQTCLQNYYIHT